MTEVESAYIPLQNTLSAKLADFEARVSDEKKRIYAEGTSAVESSGILRSAKQVGDTAVFFTLPGAYRRSDRTGATAGKWAGRAYLAPWRMVSLLQRYAGALAGATAELQSGRCFPDRSDA